MSFHYFKTKSLYNTSLYLTTKPLFTRNIVPRHSLLSSEPKINPQKYLELRGNESYNYDLWHAFAKLFSNNHATYESSYNNLLEYIDSPFDAKSLYVSKKY